MAITSQHMYGWQKEIDLMPRLTDLFGEEPVKTPDRYNNLDYTTTSYLVDLKARPHNASGDYGTWAVPWTKLQADPSGKQIVIMYYWQKDDSLFYYVVDQDHFSEFTSGSNANGQKTYFIPRHYFTRV
jgi:hypothetical protein